MPLPGKFLDDRWLDFLRRTSPLAARYPSFVSVRQEFFKSALEWRKAVSPLAELKEAGRRLVRRQRSEIPSKRSDVLFWLENRREVMVETIFPVRGALTRRGISSLVAGPAGVMGNNGLPADELLQFQAPHVPVDKKKWSALFEEIESLVDGFDSADARQTLILMGAEADRCETEARRILAALKPRLVVLAIDQLMPGSSVCVAARDMQIPSLVLLHGAVSAYNAPVNADVMGVWGEVSREQMERLGVARRRLEVLGSPRHDHPPSLGDPSAVRRLATALEFGDLPILTFFSNGNDLWRNSAQAVKCCAEWLAYLAREMRGQLNIAVRLHPNEDGRLYEGLPNLRLFKAECDLGTTLAGSTMIAGLCSTCLLEGLLYGKPVLQFYGDGWPELADNWRRGLALRTASAADLVTHVARLLQADRHRALLAEQQQHKGSVFSNQGCASMGVADYIERGWVGPSNRFVSEVAANVSGRVIAHRA